MMSLRSRTRRPLHARFARGYQAGLVVAAVVSFLVYDSVATGLDEVEAHEVDARASMTLVVELHETAQLLFDIEDEPESLALRSDLTRRLESLQTVWTAISDGELPGPVRILLFGRQGLDEPIQQIFVQGGVLGGANTRTQVDVVADSSEAERLAALAAATATAALPVVGLYEAQADSTVDAMRSNNIVTVSISFAFLVLLVVFLLRPLRRLMERESRALSEANDIHRLEAERQELSSHLAEGLESAESEDETHRVVERALLRVVPDSPVELLLADDVRGDLAGAVAHPVHGGPGCGVDSLWSCPAVRRGRVMTYEDSRSINACPHLAGRSGGACSATCVPLSFMGESMGVLHTTGPVDDLPDSATVDVLGLVASQVAVRIGTLRSFAQVELQASTDSLTGLPNRRATSASIQRLLADNETVAVAMADLDRFKQLNDRYGHEAGDRALRIFAEAVRPALRDDDVIGRWGGEEFVLVLPGMSAVEAKVALDRVRTQLADACARAEAPAVTVSMGVVDSALSTVSDELVRLADEALLAAKTQGRDRVVVGPAVAGVDEAITTVGDGVEV